MKFLKRHWLSIVSLIGAFFVFVLPFVFIFLMAVKDPQQALLLDFSWPKHFQILENFWAVVEARNYMLLTAYLNSTILTVGSVTMLVIFAAMVGFVLQRNPGPWAKVADAMILAGLLIPPAVVPTIWLLQKLHLFKTMPGMMLIEVAYMLAFSVLLYRQFVATIPRDIDEAAVIDGAGPMQVFFRVILPMLKPVTVTNIVVLSVAIFNDFVNPLYYFPGRGNETVQLTLYNFQSQFNTAYNLLFMDIVLVTIPPLIVFLFFNRQIVAGMSAGAVKG